ncbi:hypothetical protein CH373_05815 [Leptospira perolatii]|uniref:Uncharacterized protein n=1 Tax=Leptospira perolatii TaxID=2023191 RepID=A0A2M9ZQV0_9LEPT|nr:hypothetical protein [Leptospira perolatii]PJZ68390.1 hypothetical protein CH360_16590 [Leptospira perolatii]PJZ74414.1 hypothetical protein CH373_05815 [Leptospira perolatii]
MVFLLFSSAFVFFKTYGFPFSGSILLGLSLALTKFHSSKPARPRIIFLGFPLLLLLVSLWDGSSPEDILDLVCITLAGMQAGNGTIGLRTRSASVKDGLLIFLLLFSMILSYSRKELSTFLSPALFLLFPKYSKRQITVPVLIIFLLIVGIFLGATESEHPSEPSLIKSFLLFSGVCLALFSKSLGDDKKRVGEKMLFLACFLLVSLGSPGQEFTGYSLGLFFSYLQEEQEGLESETERNT